MSQLYQVAVDGKQCHYEYIESTMKSRFILLRTKDGTMQISASDSPVGSTRFHVSITDNDGNFQDLYLSKVRHHAEECLEITDGVLSVKEESSTLLFELLTLFHHTEFKWKTSSKGVIDTITIESIHYDKKKIAKNLIVHIADGDGIRSPELLTDKLWPSEKKFPHLADVT